MPQALAIFLIVLVVAIWLLVKIGQGAAKVMEDITRGYDEAAARRKESRYAKGRDKLRQYVHALIPNELEKFEKKFETTRIEFEQAKSRTNWVAYPPAWKKEEFQPLALPRKRGGTGEMCIHDIDNCPQPKFGLFDMVG